MSNGGTLWCLYTKQQSGTVFAYPVHRAHRRQPLALPYQCTDTGPSAATVTGRRIRVAVRRGPQSVVVGEWRLPRRPGRPWSLRDQGWLTGEEFPGTLQLAQHDGATWGVHRGEDGAISAAVWSPQRFGLQWDMHGVETDHSPALTSHAGHLWLAYRDRTSGRLLAASSPDGHHWSAFSPLTSAAVHTAAPALASHAGQLYAVHLQPRDPTSS
ncbi:hypothetical protein ACWGRF_07960 [Streptomyces zhihengii]